MIPEWKKYLIRKLIAEKGKKLFFVHIPKTGGTSIKKVCKKLKIKSEGHSQAPPHRKGVYFAIIRDPMKRYESSFYYRLLKERNGDFISEFFDTENEKLSDIIDRTPLKRLKQGGNVKTMTYWSKNTDILITIDEFVEFINLFGYNYNQKLPHLNTTSRKWGTLSAKNVKKLSKIYSNDIELYNYWTRTDDEMIFRY